MAVLTISRTYGCGVREMAKVLAQKLGYVLFEKEIIPLLAKKLDCDTEYAREHDELRDMFSASVIDLAAPRLAFLKKDSISPTEYAEALKDIFMELAQRGNAIVVGRGSQFILQNQPGVFHIRFVADITYRLEHLKNLHVLKLSNSHLSQKIQKEDRLRQEFLETHFQQTGENPLLYHLTINLSKISREKVQDMILQLIEKNH